MFFTLAVVQHVLYSGMARELQIYYVLAG